MAQITPLTSSWLHADAFNRLVRSLYVAIVVQVLNVIIPQIIEVLAQGQAVDWDQIGHASISIGGQALGAYILRLLDKTKIPTPQPPTDVIVASVAAVPAAITPVDAGFTPTPGPSGIVPPTINDSE